MTDNRTDGMLMPVIHAEAGTAGRFLKPYQVVKTCSTAQKRLLAGDSEEVLSSEFCAQAGRPKLAATIPNRRWGQK